MLAATACMLLFTSCGSSDSESAAAVGWEDALRMYDFGEAYEQLSEIQPLLAQTDEDWAKVTFAYGLACWHRPPPSQKMIDQALVLFEQLLASQASDALKVRTQLSIGRIYEVYDYPGDEVDLNKARSCYRQVIEDNPTGEFGYRASMRLAQTYVQVIDDDSIAEAERIILEQIDRDPDSEWASLAYQYLGDLSYQYHGDMPKALEFYQKAEQAGFVEESREHFFLWNMAHWAEELGNEEESFRLYSKIVSKHSRSPYGTLARDRAQAYADANQELGLEIPELKRF